VRFYLSKAGENINCYCFHDDCKESGEYFEAAPLPGRRRKIRLNSTVGIIQQGINNTVFCRDCIDKVYLEFSLVFNSKLWIFH
jgi:hypothetical protein